MKNILLLIPVLFVSANAFLQSNGVYVEKTSCTTAIEYNDYIVDLVQLIDDAWDKAIGESDLKKALDASTKLKTLSGQVTKSLKKLVGFDGETDFKQSTSDYVSHMSSISKIGRASCRERV